MDSPWSVIKKLIDDEYARTKDSRWKAIKTKILKLSTSEGSDSQSSSDVALCDMFHIMEKSFTKITSSWDEIGRDKAYRDKFFNDLKDQACKYYKNREVEEIQICEEVEKLGVEYLCLRDDLDAEKIVPDERYTVLELKEFLEEKMADLMEEKERRLKQYKDLREEFKLVSQQMNTEPKQLHFSCAPKLSQLDSYKTQLAAQMQELESRKKNFLETRGAIMHMVGELTLSPEPGFQNDIFLNKVKVFSDQHMASVHDYHQLLQKKMAEVRCRVDTLKEAVTSLWAFLSICPEWQRNFLQKMTNVKPPEVVEKLSKELERCQRLKLENIEKYVGEIRIEINKLWNDLCYAEQQKMNFEAFNSNEFSEPLLVAHEEYLKKLKSEFQSKENILEIFKERSANMMKMKELESKANDPDRYKNRGGKLLNEERERKQLMKQIPDCEKQLNTMAREWEGEHRQPFKVFGIQIKEFMEEQWKSREMEKENEKQNRLARKERQMLDEMNGYSTTTRGSAKRPRDTPQKMTQSKMLRIQVQKKAAVPKRRLSKRKIFRTRDQTPRLLAVEDDGNPFSVSIESSNSEFKRNMASRGVPESTRL